ncbi:MAG: hypothetical protein GXO64_04815, partial [Candidatus Micrarchaeota archaeon]|nr:hypothetical protein [Candidatus Micrarchaeota archaeon]
MIKHISIVIFLFLLLVFLSSAVAMESEMYYGNPSNGENILNHGDVILEWPGAPKITENIIHEVNLSIYYRAARYFNGLCTYTSAGKEMYIYGFISSPNNWKEISGGSGGQYIHFDGSITDKINQNDYKILVQSTSDEDKICVDIPNATMKINYTEIGDIEIIPKNTSIVIPAGNSIDIAFGIRCKNGFCGKLYYRLVSENGLFSESSGWSDDYLSSESENSDNVTLQISTLKPGEDNATLVIRGYYEGNEIKVFSDGMPVHVTVTSGSEASENIGKIMISSITTSPGENIIKGEDVTLQINVTCDEGD